MVSLVIYFTTKNTSLFERIQSKSSVAKSVQCRSTLHFTWLDSNEFLNWVTKIAGMIILHLIEV